jgi:aryl-alcohol dehydrogenase-like predicted oxidoreductase
VTSIIIGATKIDQLKHDIASAHVTLSQDVIDRIDAIHQVHMNPAP